MMQGPLLGNIFPAWGKGVAIAGAIRRGTAFGNMIFLCTGLGT